MKILVPSRFKVLPKCGAVSVWVLLALVLFCGSGLADTTAGPISGSVVATTAGDGRAGTVDGPVSSASFLEPTGVAVAPDGSLYIADASAQNVRRIQRGVVSTIAGHGSNGATLLHRVGGYLDGPAAVALFNRPVAIAVAKDGAVFVADELNHSIRKIFRGRVTTFAGSTVAGSKDGAGSVAQFALPKSMAFDDDGNLYVADYGNGIRKITPLGAVTTIRAFDGAEETDIAGISVRGAGPNLMLAYVTLADDAPTDHARNDHVYVMQGGSVEIISSRDEREPNRQDLPMGRAFGIAILDPNSVVVTDLLNNAVRYIRLTDRPFNMARLARSLGGGVREGATMNAGYRNGGSDEALFDAPMGLAISRTGTIIVADSGNRRIREIRGLNTRSVLASNLSNLQLRTKSYKVVMVGDSYLWAEVVWPESIPGRIETGLNARRSGLDLGEPVDLQAASIDGVPFEAAIDFVDTNFGDGEADLVIFFVDPFSLWNSSKDALRSKAVGAAGGYQIVYPAELKKLAAKLRKNGTALDVVVMPCCGWTAPAEEARARELSFSTTAYDFEANYQSAVDFGNVMKSAGEHTFNLLAPMVSEESRANRVTLFNSNDHHLTIRGAIWVGDEILNDLIRWAPWASPKR